MNIIKYTKLWFIISAILIIPGIIAMVTWGLNLGIDFRGGTTATIETPKNTEITDVRSALEPLKLKDLSIQPFNSNQFVLRTVTTGEKLDQNISSALTQKIKEGKVVNFESVGPTVSNDVKFKALEAIIFASLAIILYIAIAFRKVRKPASSWRFGICAILALIHDVLFVLGAFAILGHFFGYEINTLFITALLTIMGFSVHDTIVVFDRVRENLRLSPSTPFAATVNNSVVQTLARSLNTSLTVLLVLLSMYLLGGESIKPFVLALLIGITIGTFSSIFNASPLLVVWQNYIERKTQKTAA